MNEEWRDVVGFEGRYKVSNLGRVKSLDRLRKCPIFLGGNYLGNKQKIGFVRHKGRILKPSLDKRSRPRVPLLKNGKARKMFISNLVANAFILNRKSDGLNWVVNHIDNNPNNNHFNNLEWVTQKENIAHSIKQGRHSSIVRWSKKNRL